MRRENRPAKASSSGGGGGPWPNLPENPERRENITNIAGGEPLNLPDQTARIIRPCEKECQEAAVPPFRKLLIQVREPPLLSVSLCVCVFGRKIWALLWRLRVVFHISQKKWDENHSREGRRMLLLFMMMMGAPKTRQPATHARTWAKV